jgi:glutamine amidotransferase PdxT
VSRVELVPLIDPVLMVDQWITACDQEAVVFSTCSGLLIISLELANHQNSEYLRH